MWKYVQITYYDFRTIGWTSHVDEKFMNGNELAGDHLCNLIGLFKVKLRGYAVAEIDYSTHFRLADRWAYGG